MSQATVYLIRHGEKPPTGDDLSVQGVERSKALVEVFGSQSQYNIGYIMAQRPKEDGGESRPLKTITPLAESLNLEPDTSVKRNDHDDVARVIKSYSGSGNILVCWEHNHLQDIMVAMGVSDAPQYPGDRFDIIYTVPFPYTAIASTTSEACPGIDDGHKDP